MRSTAAGGGSLLFRRLFDADTGTHTYLLVDVASRRGVLIDPVFEQHSRDLSLLRELGVELVASLDTHAHADHVTGSWLLHEATGDSHYAEWYERLWGYAWQHFIDHQHGAWYRLLNADNQRFDDLKSSPGAKCDYHSLGACHELLRVITRD